MKRFRYRECLGYLLLFALTAGLCWLFILRRGMFGSAVDWISQHSVLPDYFRKQFYETGELFPEFAFHIGGGQNIYHFAYYGLLSPVILLSWLFPFVKMSDYMMTAQFFCLAASVLLLYAWLLRRKFSHRIAFGVAVMFLLAGPMIFHSCKQIMFVNYMPFLCMGFLGTDRYFDKRRPGLLIISIYLMIMTSFYFSIGGMLALVLYGVCRYFEICVDKKEKVSFGSFMSEGIRFLIPFFTAVLMSGILLVPTAFALTGRRNSASELKSLWELFIPWLSPERFFYSPYGIGLTTLCVTALVSVMFSGKLQERVLAWTSAAVLAFPVFAWLLNGGIYIRDKVMIPFLPLLCYITACYLRTLETAGTPKPRPGIHRILPALAYLVPVLIVCKEIGKEKQGGYWNLVLLEGIVTMFLFLFWRKHAALLLLPAVLSLMLSGGVLNICENQIVERDFYEAVTDKDAGRLIREELKKEEQAGGIYRTERTGDAVEKAADLNRIHDTGQLISSIYSSSYNADYQKFREDVFELEEPFRNFLMQSASDNPVFQDFMGVKYILRRIKPGSQNSERKEYSGEIPSGYTLRGTRGAWELYENEGALPVAFATDRIMTEKEYRKLSFPYNQLALLEYAVAGDGSGNAGENGRKDVRDMKVKAVDLKLPETVSNGKDEMVTVDIPGDNTENILFLQFQVKNLRPQKDLTVWVEGTRNKLTSKSHFYYNGNTVFTYAIPLKKWQKQMKVKFGKGHYRISDVKCFLAAENERKESGLCQSEFKADWQETKGNVIAGEIGVKSDGYFVTSIPYDEGFEVYVDGKKTEKEKVNTAFLGFKIGEGEHEIRIVYHAPGMLPGKLMSLAGAVLAAGLILKTKKL